MSALVIRASKALMVCSAIEKVGALVQELAAGTNRSVELIHRTVPSALTVTNDRRTIGSLITSPPSAETERAHMRTAKNPSRALFQTNRAENETSWRMMTWAVKRMVRVVNTKRSALRRGEGEGDEVRRTVGGGRAHRAKIKSFPAMELSTIFS